MDRLLGILQILVWVLWTLLEYKSSNTPFTHLVLAGEIIQRLSGIFHVRSTNFKFCTKDRLIWNDICAWFGNFRGAFYSLIGCSNQLTQNVGKNQVQRSKFTTFWSSTPDLLHWNSSFTTAGSATCSFAVIISRGDWYRRVRKYSFCGRTSLNLQALQAALGAIDKAVVYMSGYKFVHITEVDNERQRKERYAWYLRDCRRPSTKKTMPRYLRMLIYMWNIAPSVKSNVNGTFIFTDTFCQRGILGSLIFRATKDCFCTGNAKNHHSRCWQNASEPCEPTNWLQIAFEGNMFYNVFCQQQIACLV